MSVGSIAHRRHPLFTSLIAFVALGVVSTAEASLLNYTLSGGTMTGSYTLGSTTTSFTNAAMTYSVTADSSTAVAGTSSNGGYPSYYLLITSVTITLTEGSSTTTFSAGVQIYDYGSGVVAPASMAVLSYLGPGSAYSGIGFGVIDVVPNAAYPTNSPTTPYSASIAQGLDVGTTVYTDLQTTGSFAGFNFIGTIGLQVSSGGLSGTLDTIVTGGAATMTISAAAATVPLPGAAGLAACGLLGLSRRRRR